MPAFRRAAWPGCGRVAATALLLLLPGLAQAQTRPQPQTQDSPVPRAGAAARPNAGAAGPGLGPLQTEPGDIWAEVRSWTRHMDKAEAPAAAAPAKARCAAGTAGCTRKPAKTRSDPG